MVYRETVYSDMDGVMANFDKLALAGLPDDVTRIVRTNFYVAEDYPEHADLITAATADPEFFTNLEPIDNALEGWQTLIDLGYDPVVLSAPLTINPWAIEGKIKFLTKHFVPEFGASIVENAIIDKAKHQYPGLALIDDRPEVSTGEGVATWQHVVFDQPYNQLSTAAYRLMGWGEKDQLAEILEDIKRNRSIR